MPKGGFSSITHLYGHVSLKPTHISPANLPKVSPPPRPPFLHAYYPRSIPHPILCTQHSTPKTTFINKKPSPPFEKESLVKNFNIFNVEPSLPLRFAQLVPFYPSKIPLSIFSTPQESLLDSLTKQGTLLRGQILPPKEIALDFYEANFFCNLWMRGSHKAFFQGLASTGIPK